MELREQEKTLSQGLDFYKPTMSQLHYDKNRDVEVTFTFKNRGQERLADYVDPGELQGRFDELRDKSWTRDELVYLDGLTHSDEQEVFADEYIDYLAASGLPKVEVWLDEEKNDISIITTGDAPLVTFWETIVMSEVNEMYFEGYCQAKGIDPQELYEEGDRRLSEKIAILQQHPEIKFSDFGTRRHFSYKWQRYVIERLQNECPDNFVGTSNVALSQTIDQMPIGTFAHEMPMIYAGIADARGEDIRDSHNKFLQDWRELYGDNLSTALTDTFGTEFFFTDFTHEQAAEWKALRHDSGDPVAFGEKVIKFYENQGINPLDKTIVFSDGLDLNTIVQLQERFGERVNLVFGWGTTLTNDLGLKPLNIVMKATHVRLPDGQEADLVKLSDNPGKHTGPEHKVKEYQQTFAVGRIATREMVQCN